jgi:phage baseplate assembly protein W
MATGRYININYPFKDSKEGFFLDLNSRENRAIKADLLHLLLTGKGQRLYNPDFGTDLLKFIYEPLDGMTLDGIKNEINDSVKKYLPQVRLDDLAVEDSEINDYLALVTIKFTITGDVFESTEIVQINL